MKHFCCIQEEVIAEEEIGLDVTDETVLMEEQTISRDDPMVYYSWYKIKYSTICDPWACLLCLVTYVDHASIKIFSVKILQIL